MLKKEHLVAPFKGQKGIVLLVTLAILLVLTFVSAAVIRSSESANLVSGNVAVKLDALNQGEVGLASAINSINSYMTDRKLSFTDHLDQNYVSAVLRSSNGVIPDVLADRGSEAFDSNSFRSRYTAPVVPGENRVVINYLVERMCDQKVRGSAPKPASCHLVVDRETRSGSTNSDGGLSGYLDPVAFRVTVRVDQSDQLAPTFSQEYFVLY